MSDKKAAVATTEFVNVAMKRCPKKECGALVIIDSKLNVLAGCQHVETVYEKNGQIRVVFAEPDSVAEEPPAA